MEYSRTATWNDLFHVVNLLKKYKVDFILVGGYAIKSYGYSRETMDIDIAVDISTQNSEKWILALSHLPDQVTKELIGEKDPFNGDYEHAIRINDEITIDVMPSVAGIDFKKLKNNSQYIKIENIKIPILTLRGLLKTKEKSIREKDKQDVYFLKQAISKQDNNDEGPSM